MRFALPALLLHVAVAPAAPVPGNAKADAERLETLWVDLAAPRWVDRARAVYEFLDHPKGVEFLCQKVVPVSATTDDLKKWLKAINSDDEKVWKPALAELEYHDPRTALTPVEQIELVGTDAGKKRLLSVWGLAGFLDRPEHTDRVTLKVNGAKVKCGWYVGEDWHGTELDPLDYLPSDRAVWQRAALAAHILHRADAKTSRDALARLAEGYQKASPTRIASGLLKAKVPAPVTEFTDKHWDALLGLNRADLVPAELVAAVVAIREAKNAPAVLKAKLPAIKASKEQITKRLTAFDNDDSSVRDQTFNELCYFRPSLALTLSEQLDLLTTHNGRALLFQFWWQDFGFMPGRMQFSDKVAFTSTDTGLTATWLLKQPPPPIVVPVPELSKQTCAQWQRARLAIVALERNGSPEAKAVLKQLADGHPDILPTKEAKAALERSK